MDARDFAQQCARPRRPCRRQRSAAGLFKFDGNNYQLYRHDENDPHSLRDSRLHMVFCDSKGRIWTATSNGLNLYDRFADSFERIILPSMNYAGYIMYVIEQGDGTITFNVAGKGMFVVDDRDGKLDAVRYMPDFNQEIGQLCYHKDIIYISTYLGDVFAMKPNGKTHRIKVADGYITDLIPESDGNILWLVAVIPAALLILAMSIISRYELEDDVIDDINREIERRHSTATIT